VRLTINGTARAVDELTGLAGLVGLVAELTRAPRGVAVAVNGEVVPRSGWAAVELRDGDRVEVLTAAQGG
jgi:sulfur carrier protein